eukprot:NODE_6821_length_815_cov_99.754335_g6585_i0.p2 GENE.NODE_6821_length_815_cov_99.754335_g6585_i0~~NODE_6821_length_815_cov_99.754335_g6585_i0.p2  ORF type:complete len:209 (-),score=66.62 NODE_6821_length_815_cov_99.754335_g6585_i0:127-753(-)
MFRSCVALALVVTVLAASKIPIMPTEYQMLFVETVKAGGKDIVTVGGVASSFKNQVTYSSVVLEDVGTVTTWIDYDGGKLLSILPDHKKCHSAPLPAGSKLPDPNTLNWTFVGTKTGKVCGKVNGYKTAYDIPTAGGKSEVTVWFSDAGKFCSEEFSNPATQGDLWVVDVKHGIPAEFKMPDCPFNTTKEVEFKPHMGQHTFHRLDHH